MAGHRHILTLVLPLALALLCSVIAVAYWVSLPPTVQIGVVDDRSTDTAVLQAFAAQVRPDRHGIVARVQTFRDQESLRDAFRHSRIDVAAFPTAAGLPESAETLAVLSRRRVHVLTLASADNTRRAGPMATALVTDTPEHERQACMILQALAGREGGPITTLQAADAAKALEAGRVGAVAISAAEPSGLMRQFMAALSAAEREDLKLLPMPRPDQLERQSVSVEPVTVKVGAFWSVPLLPDEEIDIPSITTRLMARNTLPDDVAGHVTRAILGLQRRMSLAVPVASQIEPPPIDRASAIATHPGALAYLEGNASSFMDRFGDWIYLALFGASGLGSVIAGLIGWQKTMRRRADVRRLKALQGLIADMRGAPSAADLAALHARYQLLMDDVVRAATRLEIDHTDFLAFMIANNLYEATYNDRIASLGKPLPGQDHPFRPLTAA